MRDKYFLRTWGPGFIYLAQCGPLHKIGASKDPEVRVLKMRLNGSKSVLIHKVPTRCVRDAELLVHAMLRTRRVIGPPPMGREWFMLGRKDVEWFRSLQELNPTWAEVCEVAGNFRRKLYKTASST